MFNHIQGSSLHRNKGQVFDLFLSMTIPQVKAIMLCPLSVYCAPSPHKYRGMWHPSSLIPPNGDPIDLRWVQYC